MRLIEINPDLTNNPLRYSVADKTFYGSERNIPFDTSYEVLNRKTGNSQVFEFSHSTGPEFDPETKWVYKNDSDLKLVIGNDAEITEMLALNYLIHKRG